VKPENRKSFVVADIPGLIEGAHKGIGLGFQFLRHVERTRRLLHLVDISEIPERDPVEDLEMINRELELYSPELLEKPLTVVGTKTDSAGNGDRLSRLEEYCAEKGLDFLPVSAATGKGIRKLIAYLADALENRAAQ